VTSFLRRLWLRVLSPVIKWRLIRTRKATIGSNVRFFGLPSIVLVKDVKLSLGNNVIINSDNRTYHLNMHSPCKLFLDRPGGEISIGDNSRIHGTCIHAYQRVTIGANCLIAANSQIMDGNGHDLAFDDVSSRIHTHGEVRPVSIEDNVWIGANVVVLPGVTIGEGSVITANSVVHKDVPRMCIAGGNPAVVIKQF